MTHFLYQYNILGLAVPSKRNTLPAHLFDLKLAPFPIFSIFIVISAMISYHMLLNNPEYAMIYIAAFSLAYVDLISRYIYTPRICFVLSIIALIFWAVYSYIHHDLGNFTRLFYEKATVFLILTAVQDGLFWFTKWRGAQIGGGDLIVSIVFAQLLSSKNDIVPYLFSWIIIILIVYAMNAIKEKSFNPKSRLYPDVTARWLALFPFLFFVKQII